MKVSGTLTAGGNVEEDYAWTSDGSHVVYRADEDTNNIFELFVTPSGGGPNVKVSVGNVLRFALG